MPTSNVTFDYWINNVKKGSVSYDDDDDDEVGLTGDVISDSSGRLEFVFQKMDGMLPTMYVVFSSIYGVASRQCNHRSMSLYLFDTVSRSMVCELIFSNTPTGGFATDRRIRHMFIISLKYTVSLLLRFSNIVCRTHQQRYILHTRNL